jgi:predicted RNase H-like HicB family nuclease
VEYLVILEKAENNWAAYSPDVPGCIATGNTSEETLQEYQEALRMHLKGLIEDGLPLPEPSAKAKYGELLSLSLRLEVGASCFNDHCLKC